MLSKQQREEITSEALSWVKTPYVGHSCVKGVGTDCGQLIYGVYRACGLLPVLTLPTDYSLEVAAHRESHEYMDLIDRYFREIPESEVQPGDIVCYQMGLAMAHAAIVISWPDFVIQAEMRHGVSGSHGLNNPRLRRHQYLRGIIRVFRTLRDGFGGGL